MIRNIVVLLIKYYQRYLRKYHNRVCIYEPTCSEYAIAVIKQFGALRGMYYGYLRLKRCNGALFQGGMDWPGYTTQEKFRYRDGGSYSDN